MLKEFIETRAIRGMAEERLALRDKIQSIEHRIVLIFTTGMELSKEETNDIIAEHYQLNLEHHRMSRPVNPNGKFETLAQEIGWDEVATPKTLEPVKQELQEIQPSVTTVEVVSASEPAVVQFD